MGSEDSFYTYVGSLAQPECFEGLTFVIPEMVLPISDHQLAEFRSIAPENINDPSVNEGRGNNRATQPRDLASYPVFHKSSKRDHHEKMDHKMMHDNMQGEMGMMTMSSGCGMMEMMMGEMCMGASSIMAYAAPLAAAIAVASF